MQPNLMAQILTGLTVGVTFLVFDSAIVKSARHSNTVAEQHNSINREEAFR